jgi:hypothetical protein
MSISYRIRALFTNLIEKKQKGWREAVTNKGPMMIK